MTFVEPPALRFDLAAWSARIPRGELLQLAPFIQGPRSLVERERWRSTWRKELGPGVPVDVFVWTRGEAPHRAATKFGGLPHWPRDRPWPSRHGVPLPFLAQLLVAPSRDLFPEATGDVLCFFLDGDWADESSIEAHWVDVGGAPLVDACPIESPLRPCWGQRHRTEDHPDAARWSDARRVAVVEGTKLGGAPVRIQPDHEIPREIHRGALGSVSSHEAWPFCDAERMTHDEVFATPAWGWTFGDMGSIALLWNGGQLELDFGCH